MGWQVVVLKLADPRQRSWSPDDSPRALLGTADEVRQALAAVLGEGDWNPPDKGLFDHHGYSVEASISIWEDVETMTLDFWKGGDPLPDLRRLCVANEWQAWDIGRWEPVDLDDVAAPGWLEYQGKRPV